MINKRIINFRFFALLLGVMFAGSIVGTLFFQSFDVFYYILGAGIACALIVLFFVKRRKVLYILLIVGFLITLFSSATTINNALSYTPSVKGDNVKVKIEYVSVNHEKIYCSVIGGLKNPPKGEGELFLPNEYDRTVITEGAILVLSGVTITPYDITVPVDEKDETKGEILQIKYFSSRSKFNLQSQIVESYSRGTPDLVDIMRNSFAKSARENLPEDVRGVVFALLTGDKYGISNEIYQNYQLSGISHVLAVSGLHVNFLVVLLSWAFSKTKLKKKYSIIVILPLLILFNALCDFAPSVVRASIMSCVHIITPVITRRRYDSLSAMSLSGVILLFINPMNAFSYGFLLSFACVFGVIGLNNQISNILGFLPKWLRDSISVSLSAMLGILPLSIYLFGEISILSILTNILVLPVLGAVYGLLFVVSIIVAILPFMGFLLTAIGFVVKYINFITMVIAGIDFATVKTQVSLWFVAGYYLLGVGLTDFVILDKNKKIGLLCLFLSFIILYFSAFGQKIEIAN